MGMLSLSGVKNISASEAFSLLNRTFAPLLGSIHSDICSFTANL